MKKLILICIISLFVLTGCDKQYTEEQFEVIFQECNDEGNIPTYYFNYKEDMTVDEAMDLCLSNNKTVEEEWVCINEKKNPKAWTEAIGCFDIDKGLTIVHGNCSYVKDYFIERGNFISGKRMRCR